MQELESDFINALALDHNSQSQNRDYGKWQGSPTIMYHAYGLEDNKVTLIIKKNSTLDQLAKYGTHREAALSPCHDLFFHCFLYYILLSVDVVWRS